MSSLDRNYASITYTCICKYSCIVFSQHKRCVRILRRRHDTLVWKKSMVSRTRPGTVRSPLRQACHSLSGRGRWKEGAGLLGDDRSHLLIQGPTNSVDHLLLLVFAVNEAFAILFAVDERIIHCNHSMKDHIQTRHQIFKHFCARLLRWAPRRASVSLIASLIGCVSYHKIGKEEVVDAMCNRIFAALPLTSKNPVDSGVASVSKRMVPLTKFSLNSPCH